MFFVCYIKIEGGRTYVFLLVTHLRGSRFLFLRLKEFAPMCLLNVYEVPTFFLFDSFLPIGCRDHLSSY